MAARTQRERTDTTRAALISAALDLLDEQGWAATTSVAVCDRSGLTRGALVHHFGDLPTLLADALDSHYATLSTTAGGQTNITSTEALVEHTWRVVEAGRFKIVIEVWLAASNDPELGRSIGPVVSRFAKLVDPSEWPDALPTAESRAFYLTAREAIFGLALGRATVGAPLPHEQAVVDQLLALARTHDSDGGTP